MSLPEILDYDKDTGLIKYKNPKPNQIVGWFPGYVSSNGYYMIQYQRKSYLVHRIAFLLMTGVWPKKVVDHIDRNKKNNIWLNLRDVSRTVNNLNKVTANSNTQSGRLGVAKHPNGWSAQTKCYKIKKHLGVFTTVEEAEAAYLSYKDKLNASLM
jgi:hypothetical protein